MMGFFRSRMFKGIIMWCMAAVFAVMFGMVVASGMSMLADVVWDKRNMVIFAVSLSIGLGLQLEVLNVPPGAPNARKR